MCLFKSISMYHALLLSPTVVRRKRVMEVTRAGRLGRQPRQRWESMRSSKRPILVPPTRILQSEALPFGICHLCSLTQHKDACIGCVNSDKHQFTYRFVYTLHPRGRGLYACKLWYVCMSLQPPLQTPRAYCVQTDHMPHNVLVGKILQPLRSSKCL